VATSLTFRLYDLPVVTAALLLWRPERGPDVLRAYRDCLASAPDDVGGAAVDREVRADLRLWASGAVYLNFIGNEGEGRIVAGFGRENYTRLARVKAQYDPENIFHLNHNIRPA